LRTRADLVNLILNREDTRTVLRVANSGGCGLWIERPARVPGSRPARITFDPQSWYGL